MAKPRVIYWFRTDLRLHDSPALKAALDLDPAVLWPIFTWDPHYVYRARGGLNRWQFLLDCQNDLSKSITKVNPKSKLFVLREAPQTLLPKLFKAWNVTHIVFEKDTDSYARERDSVVTQAAKDAGVEVIVRSGRTLWDSDQIVEKHGGKPTMSITQLQTAGSKLGAVKKPIPAPKHLPDPGDMPVDFDQDEPETKPDFNSEFRTEGDKAYTKISGPKGDFAIETMEELGFPPATTPHRGGETLALKDLDKIIADKKYTATFQKPKTSPAQFEPQATTLLSPHLHFGSLSVREFYWRVKDVVDSYKGASSPPESLIGQLLFRDMYFAAQAALGYVFTQTANNPYCRFIPWHLPSKRDPETGLVTGDHHIDSEEAEVWFQRWRVGMTGFPWIDALMRQLKDEGWIHHLGRHSVACFLTRGGCYIDWERGCEVFEEWLIDHEPACNAGNWQWLSCTAFFSQYFRCYSPVSFGQKWDKHGDFIRRYVPELKNMDAKYIYEPWKAPLPDQKKAGVRVKGDGLNNVEEGTYPKPMFDFAKRRDVCISSMKTAYQVGLHGNDGQALDGTWRKLFPTDRGEVQGDIESDHGEQADYAEDGEGKTDNEAKEEGEGMAAIKNEDGAKGKRGRRHSTDKVAKKKKA
ncbi:FAD binding domain of DNA photolyase-domain-containing protein [Fusarium flagelliforme]|uniref:FAD binding domain of DNA photolyase-domain-containing protein n=1 Tax=Fusarium flagelliforme TaxID=2675880 RepID=UPI001E8CE4E7|nr:FAD binding domain of DNA photolyase-domain-containing protein [Fusarium flagelliforme]KAH7189002.1 FAD binding domain of DNA photolyase-domain-containing protein [Fusarium flagelliforme]